MTTINIIGAGKLGKTLGYCLHHQAGIEVQDIVCRTLESAQRAVQFIGQGTARSSINDISPADIWLLAVPDGLIAETAALLSDKTKARHCNLSNQPLVFHCSGAHSSALLQVLADDHQCPVASAHPIHSFADPQRSITQLAGSFCTLEGSDQALVQLTPLF